MKASTMTLAELEFVTDIKPAVVANGYYTG